MRDQDNRTTITHDDNPTLPKNYSPWMDAMKAKSMQALVIDALVQRNSAVTFLPLDADVTLGLQVVADEVGEILTRLEFYLASTNGGFVPKGKREGIEEATSMAH